jgi:hypothetical protein
MAMLCCALLCGACALGSGTGRSAEVCALLPQGQGGGSGEASAASQPDVSRPASPQRQAAGVSRPVSPQQQRESGGEFVA